jgi:Fe2+ or Zn2+ uptake regulation protein
MSDDKFFEDKVIEILQKELSMKKNSLVKKLAKENKNKIGFSENTIYRKLKQLIKENIVCEIKFKELDKHGIIENDRRTVYVILKKSSDIKKYLDEIFDLLVTGDDVDKGVILKEIEVYKKQYSLDAQQIDKLVKFLDTENLELLDHLLRIIYDWITKFKRIPKNKKKIDFCSKKIIT